jgi:hypothetical protein
MSKDEIIELINERRDIWLEERKRSSKLYANSYGAGADYGMVEACNILIEDIKELFDLNSPS